ncbi:tetratricopeptide repeat protein [Niveispirillum sp.]|uniref:tetratricopeptide repeat protein n=1 Tax=Niveispirillum sp. TaxID=1917217 RepID=UPI001B54B740|nr:tetratricopeptide repeat protein [Niveispirillum sp.]MBP7337767.1 tetratricopeptide repeat protein [Niveispirillum sp.]
MDAYAQAVAHHRAGRGPQSIAAARQAVVEAPDDPLAHNLLGVCLTSTPPTAEGIQVLRAAVARWPNHEHLVTNLALALQSAGEQGEAWRYLRHLLVLNPASALACDRLGFLCNTWRGDREQAARLSDRAARLSPQDEGIRINQSLAWAPHDLDRTILALDAATIVNPQNTYPYVQRAGALLRRGRWQAALHPLRRALKLDPTNDDAIKHALRCQRYHAASQSAAAQGPGPGDGLLLRGPFSTASGYAHMGRRYIQTLRRQQVPLQVIGVFGHETWADEPLEAPVGAKAAINIMVPLAVEPIPGLATILYSMFEGPRISRTWAKQSLAADMVIVPTESSRVAWASQGYPEDRIRVCPLGVDAEPAAADAPPLTLVDGHGRRVDSYRHRFLNVSDAIPRKNLDGVLRVWLRATNRDDDAVLILKPGKGGTEAARRHLQNIVRQTQDHVGRAFTDAAPIVLIDQPLSEAEMTGLFRTANHYFSLSHGEGWDLPLSKAGAMGMGLIAPAHSSYLDYLDERFARLIPCTTGPAHLPYSTEPWEPFFGLDWWNPDETVAAGIISDIIAGRDKGLPDASAHLLGNFTWDQAARKLRRILADAGLLRQGDRS